MPIHFLEIDRLGDLNGSSSISTMSAASIAASDPMAPMAIPISALERTGASLMPSPTNASFSFSDFLPAKVLRLCLPCRGKQLAVDFLNSQLLCYRISHIVGNHLSA